MKTPVALVLVLAIVMRETPAAAAAPDLGEARRRFVAAVHSSDKAVAAAEAALDAAIAKAAVLTSADAQRSREAMSRLLAELRKFKAEMARLLSDLGTYEKLLRAAADYARACEALGTVIRVAIAVIVPIVNLVKSETGGTLPVWVVVVAAAVAAVVVCVTTISASLPEILRALGFRDAGDSAERWMKDNSWVGTTVAVINIVAAVISSVAAATVSLRAAEAAARDAQARLDSASRAASGTVQGAAVASQKAVEQVLSTFDGDLGGSFHVKLENGQATRTALTASLHGSVAITSKANPALKLVMDGDVSLTAGGGGGWASLRGHGTARLSGFGPFLTIPNTTVESQGVAALTLRGDVAPVRGCTHSVEAGSLFETSRLSLAGSLRCGPWSLSSSTLKLEGGGVSGGGTLAAWSKNFAMSYAASGDGLVARGSISGGDTPWARVPGFEAEYRIEAPKLDLKLEGPSLSPTLSAGKVNVRTVAKKKDGSPWSSASLTPDVMRVPAPPATSVPVPFPNLPPPSDVFKGARDACEASARKTLFGQARDRALEACRSANPPPPAVPALPNKLDVRWARSSDDPSRPPPTRFRTTRRL